MSAVKWQILPNGIAFVITDKKRDLVLGKLCHEIRADKHLHCLKYHGGHFRQVQLCRVILFAHDHVPAFVGKLARALDINGPKAQCESSFRTYPSQTGR